MKYRNITKLVCSTVVLFLANAEIAQAGSISVVGKDSVSFTVNNLSNVAGFGAHFSSGVSENGFGGVDAECHFVSGTAATPGSTVTLLCYDGYKSPTEHTNMFRLELGPKKETTNNSATSNTSVLSHATFTISRRGVQVDVTRIATNVYTTEKKPYTISSFFPLREETGFFKNGTINYANSGLAVNGVLNGDPSRQGSGYSLEAIPIAR